MEATHPLSDRVVAFLRTAVPVVWGYIITWALTQFPAVADFLAGFNVDLNAQVVVSYVTGLATIAWYAVWRWLEPRIPAWLTALVLGSNRTPVYIEGTTPGTKG